MLLNAMLSKTSHICLGCLFSKNVFPIAANCAETANSVPVSKHNLEYKIHISDTDS